MYFANKGIRVYGYDLFTPLVKFWQQVINNPNELIKEVKKYHPLDKEQFYKIQESILKSTNDLEIAAKFFVLNRSSYSGMTLSGGMSPNHPRFTLNSINKIKQFTSKNITVEKSHFQDSIKLHKEKLLYCDPPYYIESNNLYGVKGDKHKSFEHEELYETLKKHDKWILSYNNHEYIRELYKNYEQIQLDWSYGTSRDTGLEPKELIILNL